MIALLMSESFSSFVGVSRREKKREDVEGTVGGKSANGGRGGLPSFSLPFWCNLARAPELTNGVAGKAGSGGGEGRRGEERKVGSNGDGGGKRRRERPTEEEGEREPDGDKCGNGSDGGKKEGMETVNGSANGALVHVVVVVDRSVVLTSEMRRRKRRRRRKRDAMRGCCMGGSRRRRKARVKKAFFP